MVEWKDENTINITTNLSTIDYQLISNPILITPFSTFELPFEVELLQGGFGIGIESQDGSKFLAYKYYRTPGIIKDVLRLPFGTTDQNVKLVFANNIQTPGISRFLIRDFSLTQSPLTDFELSGAYPLLTEKTLKLGAIPSKTEQTVIRAQNILESKNVPICAFFHFLHALDKASDLALNHENKTSLAHRIGQPLLEVYDEVTKWGVSYLKVQPDEIEAVVSVIGACRMLPLIMLAVAEKGISGKKDPTFTWGLMDKLTDKFEEGKVDIDASIDALQLTREEKATYGVVMAAAFGGITKGVTTPVATKALKKLSKTTSKIKQSRINIAEGIDTSSFTKETKKLIGRNHEYKVELLEREGAKKGASTLRAAQKEMKGQQIEKALERGIKYNHVEKAESAQRGLTRHIQKINNRLSYPELPQIERQALQKELSQSSRLLDYAKQFLKDNS